MHTRGDDQGRRGRPKIAKTLGGVHNGRSQDARRLARLSSQQATSLFITLDGGEAKAEHNLSHKLSTRRQASVLSRRRRVARSCSVLWRILAARVREAQADGVSLTMLRDHGDLSSRISCHSRLIIRMVHPFWHTMQEATCIEVESRQHMGINRMTGQGCGTEARTGIRCRGKRGRCVVGLMRKNHAFETNVACIDAKSIVAKYARALALKCDDEVITWNVHRPAGSARDRALRANVLGANEIV
mmetsp:Transcript_2241/g.7129  ORF Transcript_2241/g.7129 Transcript_2241/m.7129 type:complete len:244 (-) Transcript_2241:219-950(-)